MTVFTEATDPMCLPADAARALLAEAPWRRYAVLGDSIAQGVGDPSPGYAPVPWADRVAEALGPELTYLNTGKMGATSREVIDTQLQRVLDFRPDLVHISGGANDLWAPDADLEVTARNLDALFAAVDSIGARTAIFTIADVFVGSRMQAVRARFAAYNDVVREVASRYDSIVVELWNHPLRHRPDVLSADRIHFTMVGHAVAATEMIMALSSRLAPTSDDGSSRSPRTPDEAAAR